MQRKKTKNTPLANAAEKRFMAWVKIQPCAFCDMPGPSIADHCEGAAFKHNKTLCGHFYIVPKCETCDSIKTNGNHRWHLIQLGKTHREAWLELIPRYEAETGRVVPEEVVAAIKDWKR